MNNLLLIGLVTVLVIVNVYFTYRREEGLDKAGRKMLAAMQLLYLVFIFGVFLLAFIANRTGITSGARAASQNSWIPFIVATVIIVLLYAILLIVKARIENKIRDEHRLK